MIFDPWSITLCCFSILSTFLPILLSPDESFLDFLKNLSLWIYLSFLYFIQLSPLSLSSLFSNKYRFGFISWLEFQSISSDSKLFRLSVPRTLMPVQAIWSMELPVHHEESSRSNWKLYHLLTFLLKLDEGFRSQPKNQDRARLWHSHYHYNHEGGVNGGQVEGDTYHQLQSWKI